MYCFSNLTKNDLLLNRYILLITRLYDDVEIKDQIQMEKNINFMVLKSFYSL